MIRYEVASDLVPNGFTEDGEQKVAEVFYVVAVDEKGYRWRGPNLPPCPDLDDNWQPHFPVYGSEAYVESGQEAAYLEAERSERPYYPV